MLPNWSNCLAKVGRNVWGKAGRNVRRVETSGNCYSTVYLITVVRVSHNILFWSYGFISGGSGFLPVNVHAVINILNLNKIIGI